MSRKKKEPAKVYGWFDATCPGCGKRVGWFGELTDHPPCHRCGAEIDSWNWHRVRRNKAQQLLAQERAHRLYYKHRNLLSPSMRLFLYRVLQMEPGKLRAIQVRSIEVIFHRFGFKDRKVSDDAKQKVAVSGL